jgi:hypothetical protein
MTPGEKVKTMKPKIITRHDWISVDFGNGRRLTVSRSGEKATGAVPHHVFREWSNMIRTTTGDTYSDRIEKFVADIDSVWPEWHVAPPTFKVGQTVKYDFGPRRGGMAEGVIVKVLRSNYTVRFDGMGLVRIPGDMLAENN